MQTQYPKASGPLLEAVLHAQRATGNPDGRRAALQAVIKACPHAFGDVVEANGSAFEGKKLRVKEIDVNYGPHYASHTQFNHESLEWYWILRGPLILKNGTESEINSAMRLETFHVHITPSEPIPGDAGW